MRLSLISVIASLAGASAIPLEVANASPKGADGSPAAWTASSLEARVLAQSICASTSRVSGATFAVRRACDNESPDCHTVCSDLKDGNEGGQDGVPASFEAYDSLHISGGEGSSLPGELGLRTFKYGSTRVKGCGPNYCCCREKSAIKFLLRPTCMDILKAGESKGSGVYLLNPKGNADSAFEAYCDMTTDGGGWTLWAAAARKKGQFAPLKSGTMPTDPEASYSYSLASRAGFIADDVKEVRFYCESSNHPRRIHFSTKNADVIASALDRSGSLNADAFKRGSKLLQGHTAHLPASTVGTGASSLFEDAFFDGNNHYWSVRPADKHFRCDDAEEDDANTRHLMFFR